MFSGWTSGDTQHAPSGHDASGGLAPPLQNTILGNSDVPVTVNGVPQHAGSTVTNIETFSAHGEEKLDSDFKVVPVGQITSQEVTPENEQTYNVVSVNHQPADAPQVVFTESYATGHTPTAEELEHDRMLGSCPSRHREVSVDEFDPAGVRELRKSIVSGAHANFPAIQEDPEKGHGLTHDPFATDSKFDLEMFIRKVLSDVQTENNEPREMGVAFQGLTVTGTGVGAKLGDTVGSMVTAPIDTLMNAGSIFKPPVKYILRDVTGCVKPGEMLLVLGRPGSGCTTFLKSLASYRDGFRSIEGTVLYEGLDHKAIDGPLRGDVVYSPEDDIHFPTLSVGDTINFATAARTPNANHRVEYEGSNSRPTYISLIRESIATVLGLRHTYNTKVGNDVIRGVSGGERKRVSIAEAFAARARIAMFDNSSRGLDSSTALEFTKALRIATDVARIAMFASIYQAGEALTRTFDKIVLFNHGHMVYFGPVHKAADYFKSIGFLPQDRQTTADFLVACTDPNGRRLNPDFKGRIPLTPEEQARAFAESQAGRENAAEVEQYLAQMQGASSDAAGKQLIKAARAERAKNVPKRSPYLLSWPMQVRLAIKRRAQVAYGDITTQIMLLLIIIFQSFIIGSAYYNMGATSAAVFPRGGVLFFCVLYNAFMGMSEIAVSYSQRPIVIRQKRFAMLRPSADAIGVTLLDIPVRIVSLTAFCIIIYFLSGLSYDAGKFFIFWSTVLLVTYTLVAFFRMTAALTRNESIATMVAGLAIIDVALYAGFAIPRPSMVIWWKWLSYCNPVSFSFEILMLNEFRGLNLQCVNMVPAGPGYENAATANKVCPVAGSQPGEPIVNGLDYLYHNYGYKWENAGRNAGIVIAMFVFFVFVYMAATEFQIDPSAAGGVMIFKRNNKNAKKIKELHKSTSTVDDPEAHAVVGEDVEEVKEGAALEVTDDIFSWHNINYDVQIKSETRRLLDNVSGYVAPGKMTALMGESGAGKTTLLNVLAQRVDTGVITGDFFVNGNPLPKSFQADAGYCQQQDVHLAQQTVREALQFSALLRQPRETPKEERLAYVETVIDLLEMNSFADALVGEVGEGLNVEQRKRLTIGVELAAKPKLLLFLDEPTSGLDGQAAWSIVKFLKKLAKNGQAILCTIHQPSGELFNQFDRLLLLKKGGKTVYFGDIGPNATTLLEYFESRSGIKVREEDNPAEYILEAIGAGATANTDKDWPQLFKESPLAAELDNTLKDIMARRGTGSSENATVHDREYAQSDGVQFGVILKRLFVSYWRNPQYLSGKVGLNLIAGLFIGSSFWDQGRKQSNAALQNKLFAIFMSLAISTSLAQQLQPVFIQMRTLYEVRERPSKMYRWYIFVLGTVLVEIPWNILSGTLFWIPWYFMVHFSYSGKIAGYSWGMYMLFQLYFSSFAQAVAALSPNAMLASVIYATLFSFVLIFCGVVQPPGNMPYFWRKWMFPLSPFTYIVEGMLGNALHGEPVRCTESEFSRIVPPAGQTCAQYLANFSMELGSPENGVGYFRDAPDGNGCDFCSMRYGEDFLTGIQLSSSNRYRNIGILIAYIAFGYICTFAFFYLFHYNVESVASNTGSNVEVGSAGVQSNKNTEKFYDAPSHPNNAWQHYNKNDQLEAPYCHHQEFHIDEIDPEGVRALRKSIATAGYTGLKSDEVDLEKDQNLTHDPFSSTAKFDLELYLRNIIEDQQSRNNEPREMGLAFRGLTVTGTGVGAKLADTVGSLFTGPIEALMNAKAAFNPPVKHILRDVTGSVKPGEMLLVLGRPGSGCTTFLKSLASYRDGFRSIEGEVLYEGLDHKAIDGPLRGDVVYSPEDDIHFPTLSVGDTIAFASAARAPNSNHRIEYEGSNSRQTYISLARESIATILGLRHTYNTKVGNDVIRGVSGGERKRVSIAETFASRARITMFDNSSRGLDSSTALEFVKSLRVATDIGRVTTMASIYQAGEALTKTFDKVIVLNQGYVVYFGPVHKAADYFKSIGYLPQDRQTTADFLVACTDPNGRRLNPDFKGRIPLTAEEQARAFVESPAGKENVAEVDAYIDEMRGKTDKSTAKQFIKAARAERAKNVPKKSMYLLSWPMQVRLAIKRRAQVAYGDLITQVMILVIIIFQSFIIGSAYYNMGATSAAVFPRGGVLFFCVLYNAFMGMSEIAVSYSQRPIVIRQKRFAMLRPSADAIGVTLLDIPVRIVSLTAFCIIIYFLSGLDYNAGKFFIFWSTVLLVTYTLVAFFRMTAALTRNESIATMIAGLAIIDVALYAGYAIPRPSMVIWWKWLSYCNPVSFSFEILMLNEFRGLNLQCMNMVPAGPGYENAAVANKVCPVAGSQPGEPIVNGLDYLYHNYGYKWENAGRNAGIVIAMFVFFVFIYMAATEFQTDPAAAGGVMIFNRNKDNAKKIKELRQTATPINDPEAQAIVTEDIEDVNEGAALEVSDDIFSWHNINYDVQIKTETRRLLDNVSGYVAPGKMTALMGESGAGKTTLLNVLAQRVDTGVITGDFFVNGNPLPKSFQADAGYCQQQDVHLAQQTVREALQFSALLRQPRETPKEERLAYVETVIDLLEMRSFADAIVGDVGEGLNVEQRKRLTIGVELAAKPKLLLFLDEPTSGLDGQAAWSIVKFLKKLAKNGQAILCTIHQPSGELFNQFDRLLLLKKGGKTVYFGDIGPNATTLLEYFESRSGIKVHEEDNPAEYILEAIGAGATATTDKDWPQLFKDSPLAVELDNTLKEIMARRGSGGVVSSKGDDREYAQSDAMQFSQILKRLFISYWRNPQYLSGKLALNLISGLFIGSSFWDQGRKQSNAALQNKLFSIFMALAVSTPLAQQLQPVLIQMRTLYEVRERPSKMYRWYVFVLGMALVEIPWNIVGGTLLWIPWYFMTHFSYSGKHAGYSWGMYMLFQFYFASFAQSVAIFSPNAMLASVIYSTLFSFVLIFCGVVQPPANLPYFWRKWMFPLSPFTYIIEGLMGDALHGEPVRCTESEFSRIIPPAGQTCAQYLGNFSMELGSPENGMGYFRDAPDGNGCDFCSMRYGEEFLTGIQLSSSNRYRNIGILIAYIAFGYICMFALFYLFRVASWKRKSKK
ncbi:hypothetical protein MCUN1_001649 [Malassezia cuniculi]|uniref:ABC transporter domain-containing protein n=1 Tax=Malassezia cuniculi TaxID=948313 RepID=A0AAF0ET76_9BASI|nr:hypothetical protein MCUN1_001649 [Malassezia cuniculi]